MLSKPIIQIEPTNYCNQSCDICMRSYQRRKLGFMDVEEFKKFIDVNKPFYVGLHGWGEPLLHKGICDMIRYAASRGSITSLITNGTLLDGEVAKDLITSGLRELVFGVYRIEKLEKISSNIRNVVELKRELGLNKPKIFLDITVYEENRAEVLEIIERGASLGVEAINLHRIFNLHNPSHRALGRDEEKALFKEAKKLSKALGLKIVLPKDHKIPCRVAKYSIFITWDFAYTPCCFMPEECFAEGSRVRIRDVVSSKAYKEFIKNMAENPVCSKCII